MRVLSLAIVLLITGCSSSYRQIPASEPVAMAARIDTTLRVRAEEEAAAAAAAKTAHNANVTTRAEARTTYVAENRDSRPQAVIDALVAGDRIVLGMTSQEVLLVIETAALVDRVVSEKGVVEHWTSGAAPVTGMTFANGKLFSWTTATGPATPAKASTLVSEGEQVQISMAKE